MLRLPLTQIELGPKEMKSTYDRMSLQNGNDFGNMNIPVHANSDGESNASIERHSGEDVMTGHQAPYQESCLISANYSDGEYPPTPGFPSPESDLTSSDRRCSWIDHQGIDTSEPSGTSDVENGKGFALNLSDPSRDVLNQRFETSQDHSSEPLDLSRNVTIVRTGRQPRYPTFGADISSTNSFRWSPGGNECSSNQRASSLDEQAYSLENKYSTNPNEAQHLESRPGVTSFPQQRPKLPDPPSRTPNGSFQGTYEQVATAQISSSATKHQAVHSDDTPSGQSPLESEPDRRITRSAKRSRRYKSRPESPPFVNSEADCIYTSPSDLAKGTPLPTLSSSPPLSSGFFPVSSSISSSSPNPLSHQTNPPFSPNDTTLSLPHLTPTHQTSSSRSPPATPLHASPSTPRYRHLLSTPPTPTQIRRTRALSIYNDALSPAIQPQTTPRRATRPYDPAVTVPISPYANHNDHPHQRRNASSRVRRQQQWRGDASSDGEEDEDQENVGLDVEARRWERRARGMRRRSASEGANGEVLNRTPEAEGRTVGL
ncbi:MAG: hypothetical protein M1833_002721 [Piccolia ochrophora]|nr:MAG: hypothetical protein M1833_002721 [Piccolia ochrophora]